MKFLVWWQGGGWEVFFASNIDTGSHPRCWTTALKVMTISFQRMWTCALVSRLRLNNNTNPIWGGSVSKGEELPSHSGESRSLPSGWPNPTQLSRTMSSGHHIFMEHRRRKKKHQEVNSDTDASNGIHSKEKRRNIFFEDWKGEKREMKNMNAGSPSHVPFRNSLSLSTEAPKIEFVLTKNRFYNRNFTTIFPF